MKNFPPTDGSDDSQNEEIIYEEVVGGPFPPKGGRIPPMGGFAPPPFGGYVIEEEIIEEIEEDPTECAATFWRVCNRRGNYRGNRGRSD